jgi:hypothetical protein
MVALVSAAWVARGVWDEQLSAPIRLKSLEDWKESHIEWANQRESELRTQITTNDLTNDQQEKDIDELECKVNALITGGNPAPC